MSDNLVNIFEAGMLTNVCKLSHAPKQINSGEIIIDYPTRLEAMALDPAQIATNESLIYTAGQIDFSVKIFRTIHVVVEPGDDVVIIGDNTKRRALVLHAALLMKKALGYHGKMTLDVSEEVSLRHCGLGSSSATIAGVASAINELFGNPIDPGDLCVYCAQNHGEEIDGSDDRLVAVQCIGGSAVCGNYDGALIILAGQATPIYRKNLPEGYSVVIGVPNEFTHPDSKELMTKEEENMDGFLQTGKEYGSAIAYRLIHEVFPGLEKDDYEACKKLIFDYRWRMGSIRNCSFVLPRINEVADSLFIFEDDPSILCISLSSVGPGFFAITNDPNRVVDIFSSLSMNTLVTMPHNDKYIVRKIRND